MTAKEYIEFYQSHDIIEFLDLLPSIINGEYTSDGKYWFPCVILDEPTKDKDTIYLLGNDAPYIVTRNQTFMHVKKENVRVLL